MRPITVVHSSHIWLPQTQTWLYNQLRHLPSDIIGHIVCERTDNLDQFELPNIHCVADLPVWRRRREKALRKLRLRTHLSLTVEIARRHHADIIHSHFGNIGWADMGAARRAGVKHVVTFYGLDVGFLPRRNPLWYRRYRALFDHVDIVQCEGGHMAGRIAALGCPDRKIRVHHLGIALDEVPFAPLSWRQGDPLRILIAASFREKKGIPDALEALGRLRDRTPLEITLIGDAGDDRRAQAEKTKILATIERLGLCDRVRLTGYQPHARLLEEARRHHVFLSPSLTARDGDTEGGAPVSLIEMAASGMMMVSTTHCDIPEVVRHGVSGLLSEERDIDGLVENLEWLVAHPKRWDEMRIAGREHVEEKFDARVQAERQAETYKALLGRGGP